MFGYLKGKIIAKNPDSHQWVILTHRLGLEVTVPTRLYDLQEVGATATLWLYTHVREDALVLFGFASEQEKHFFKQLLGVSGLGPKTALALLSEHGASRLTQLLMAKDADSIASAPGVGKKLAQRLVLELSGKVEKWAWLETIHTELIPQKAVALSAEDQLREDLSSALLNLGYLPSQVKFALDKLLQTEGFESQGFESCLRGALREISSRSPRPSA